MNLKLVIQTYLCGIHHQFLGVESFDNDLMLSDMSK